MFNALFGLLCWPAVFAPVPGAFFHPFQRGPADLGAPDFPARRAAQFQACLALLDTPEYRDEIGRRYRDKQGLQSPSYPGTRCPNRCWRWRWIACRRLT